MSTFARSAGEASAVNTSVHVLENEGQLQRSPCIPPGAEEQRLAEPGARTLGHDQAQQRIAACLEAMVFLEKMGQDRVLVLTKSQLLRKGRVQDKLKHQLYATIAKFELSSQSYERVR